MSRDEISPGKPAVPLLSLALIQEQLLLIGMAVFLCKFSHVLAYLKGQP